MAMSQMKRYASGNLATLPEDLRCELLLVQISRLSKSVKSLMAELKNNFKVLDERETYIELQQDVMSRLKDANSALTRKLMECCCQQNIGKLNCVVEIQGDDKVGCASLSISDITLAADSDLAREKIASACFIRQEKHFVSVTSFTSEKIEGNTSGRSLNLKNYGTSMKRSETCLTNNLSFNSLRRRFKTYMNRMTKDGGFRYSWSGRQDDEKIIGGKAMKPMNSEGDLWSYVNKGFQNQDLLDNGGAGNRLDDVNNLLLGGGGGDSDAYQAAAPGGSNRNLYVPRQRLMHFDLKGAPPRVSYLKRILPLVKELGATGVLMEWEDMFPWSGHLAPLAAGNAYSRQDVQEIIDAAVNNGLEVIPLVQTFGHVEFALKHSDFTELREVPESPQALCPSLNTSHDFVHQMIEQVMDMHKNIRYLHIGCDEVFQMGECVRCRTQPRDSLFLNHVTRVASFVRTRYPGVTPIIWDDMLRHLPPISLEQFRIGELVEPMVWVYAEDVYRFVPTSVWEKYAAIFPRVWAASAFKGAFGETLYVPNAKRHLENNMRWLQVMQAEAPKFTGGFQGIAITGWQRYDHFAVLCELLPSAIPSLAVNLLVTSHGYFNQSLRPKLHNSLSCGVFVPSGGLDRSSSFLSLNNDPFLFDQFSRCVFPGHAFFRLLYRLSTVEREVAEAVAMIRKDKGWMTDYNVRHNFSSPLRVDELMVDHQRLYHSVTSLVRGAKDALWEIFDAYTVAEWIEQRIYPMVQQLESISRDSITLKQPRTWPKRPFPILSDLHRIGLQFAADASPG